MEVKSAKGAKAWLEITKKASIPILKASAKLLTQQIKAGASLAKMAVTIERDPALCLHLFLAANRKNRAHNNDNDVEILSLNHVITILGMQGVVDCVKQAPQIKLHKSDAYQKAYLQAQSSSHFGGQLMAHWVKVNHTGSAEKLKWATILAGAPRWILWREAYPQMRKYEWLVEHDFQGLQKAEKKIFGCKLDDIICVLGRKLMLPNMAQSVLERNQLPSLAQWGKLANVKYLDFIDADTKLKRLKSNPTTLMAVILHLAQQLPRGWMTSKSLRAQKVLSHLTAQNVNSVIQQNHQLAVAASHHGVSGHTLLPAVSLLWPTKAINQKPWLRTPMLCLLPEKEIEQRKNKPVAVSTRVDLMDVPPPREPDRRLLMDLINQFKSQLGSFKTVHDILLTCNKAIFEGLGMRRACICVLSQGGKVLIPHYCVGIPNDSPVRDLKIPMDENRLFTKLLTKIASYKVDVDNYSQVLNMLSTEVADVMLNKNFMVMSIFANDKPIGVVYADACSKEENISETEYMAFKTICQSTSFALGSYAHKQKKKAG
jgi:hypothetical protein